jgi:hypothetical protein
VDKKTKTICWTVIALLSLLFTLWMKLEPFTSDPGAEGYQLPPTQTNWFTWMFELFFSTLFFFFFFGGISFVLWVVFIRWPWGVAKSWYIKIRLQRDATNQAVAKKRHYIHQDERQLGPFSYVELQKYLDEEVLSVKDLAAEESSDEWVPLGIYMDSLNSQLPSGHERRKFSIPKLIAIAGLVLLVAACLYPPVYSESYEGRMWIGFGGTKTIDYGPEFRYDPNWRQRNVAERQQALNEVMYGRTETVHINTQRLLIDCCIILATTVIGVTLTSRRRVRR